MDSVYWIMRRSARRKIGQGRTGSFKPRYSWKWTAHLGHAPMIRSAQARYVRPHSTRGRRHKNNMRGRLRSLMLKQLQRRSPSHRPSNNQAFRPSNRKRLQQPCRSQNHQSPSQTLSRNQRHQERNLALVPPLPKKLTLLLPIHNLCNTRQPLRLQGRQWVDQRVE